MIRVDVDTSVFGGVFDDEFRDASEAFFSLAHRGLLQIVISPLVDVELAQAPEQVLALYSEVKGIAESVRIDAEAQRLSESYLAAKVLTENSAEDALHVALASVARCSAIVSWNFRHIVNMRRIPLYNGVNLSMGYSPIAIHTPQEVQYLEDE